MDERAVILYELAPADYHRTRRLFTGLPLSLAIEAVIAGNSPARLWTDDITHPAAVFMWDAGHSYFLVGNSANAAFNAAAQECVADHVKRGPFCGKIHYTPPAWKTVVPLIFSGLSLVSAPRALFALEEFKPSNWAERVPDGFRIEPIDEMLQSRSQVGNLPLVTDEIGSCWSSLDRFLAKGFGFCLVRAQGSANAEEIVCWCTAEYVSGKTLGIGIETLPAYQGRGFATLTAARFLQHCQTSGLRPYWDAFQSNAASLAVARKVGLERVADYMVFLARSESSG